MALFKAHEWKTWLLFWIPVLKVLTQMIPLALTPNPFIVFYLNITFEHRATLTHKSQLCSPSLPLESSCLYKTAYPGMTSTRLVYFSMTFARTMRISLGTVNAHLTFTFCPTFLLLWKCGVPCGNTDLNEDFRIVTSMIAWFFLGPTLYFSMRVQMDVCTIISMAHTRS